MQQQAGQQVQAAAGGQQPDYSKQWAEYYRNIGKIEEAEAIENQMKAAKVNDTHTQFFVIISTNL